MCIEGQRYGVGIKNPPHVEEGASVHNRDPHCRQDTEHARDAVRANDGTAPSSDMPRARHPRGEPKHRSASLRTTARDLWLLEGLAKMRFCTTRQIAELYFDGSRWAANKRLRRLFDAGLVQVWVRSLSQDNVYSVTQAGVHCLDAHGGDSARHGTSPRGLAGNLDHLLAINQVRIALALGLPDVGGELSWWRSDWELRSHGRARIVPDALFEISWEQASNQTFALEVENRTKSPRRFLKKIRAYASRRQQGRGLYGRSDVVVLVVGKDQRWVERYRRELATARVGGWVWFTTLAAIEATGVVAPIWRSADNGQNFSLRNLAFSPYRKDMDILGTSTFPQS